MIYFKKWIEKLSDKNPSTILGNVADCGSIRISTVPLVKEIEAIHGISLDITERETIKLDPAVFMKMHNLRFLSLNSKFARHCEDILKGFKHLEYFPTNLTCFVWSGCPMKSWQFNSLAENLVTLQLHGNHVEQQLWNGVENLVNLRYINVRGSVYLRKIPNLSKAPNLKEIHLENSRSLSEINSASIQNLSKLILDLSYCIGLSTLPHGIQSKHILLKGCSNINLPTKISCKVKKLDLRQTAIKELPFIEQPSELVALDLSGCSRLRSLSSNLCDSKYLKYLSLHNCSKLECLPHDFGNLEALEILVTSGTVFKKLPLSFLHLSMLSSFSLPPRHGNDEAPMAWRLNSVSGFRSLKHLLLPFCQITELPDDLGQLSFLELLDLSRNYFESMPTSIKDLLKLQFLNIRHCYWLLSLPELPKGIDLEADNCSSLELISDLSFIFSPMRRPQKVNFANCFKTNLVELLHKESHQEICDCICYPGNEIPEWFSIHGEGSSISLEQPPDWNNDSFQGFIICIVVTIPPHKFRDYCCLHYKPVLKNHINFKFKYEMDYRLDDASPSWCSSPDNGHSDGLIGKDYIIESDHVLMRFINRNKMKKIGNNNVLIEFVVHDLTVKKCGIHFLYAEDCVEPTKGSRSSLIHDEERDEGEEDEGEGEGDEDEPYYRERWLSSRGRRLRYKLRGRAMASCCLFSTLSF